MLLDCAAFAPTSRLDLSKWEPDFVAVSFYKMFGYPTGLGALIARRRGIERLQRPWFSGGTVVAANVEGDMVVPHSGHARFEDGTVDPRDPGGRDRPAPHRADRDRHDLAAEWRASAPGCSRSCSS